MSFIATVRLHAVTWFLERKLSRRTPANSAGVTVRVLAIRIYSAAACFLSMLLAAWIGAFARAVSAHEWHVFRTLDGMTLLAVSARAGRYQGDLIPVLLSWAVLLLLTPTGYTVAFRAAVAAAGILGYLDFSPPSFLVTTRVNAVSHWLVRFDHNWNRYAIPVLISSIAIAYVLQSSAVTMFRHLGHLSNKSDRIPHYDPWSPGFIRRLCAMPLVLLVLLSAAWAATVVRLAVSGASGTSSQTSYGFQGGLYQSKYLLLLVLMAVFISWATTGQKWFIGAVAVTALYSLVPHTLALPSYLEVSAARGQLTRIGTAWGADSLWAALFIFIPAVVLGIHLIAKLLRSS